MSFHPNEPERQKEILFLVVVLPAAVLLISSGVLAAGRTLVEVVTWLF